MYNDNFNATGIDRGFKPAPSGIEPTQPTVTKNTEPAPKYDPCRLFRKGDKVQVKKRNGRCYGKDGEYLREAFCTVAEDETQNELVRVLHNASEYRLDPAYLALVAPVEDPEPYIVGESSDYFCVETKDGNEISCYWKDSHPNPQAGAVAERDRMNDWSRGSGQINPTIMEEPSPVGIVKGRFFKPAPEVLSVVEKRRFLANVFRSPEFSDIDKFTALQEDNRMLAMFSLGNGKEQE